MQYRFLGKTGLRVAALAMGCMTFEPGMVDEDTAFRMLDAYVDAGGNFLDMANNYPGVEEKFGKWLASRGGRSQHIVATKVRFPIGPGPNDVGLTRKHILDSVEESLRRTGTDYIDLLQLHCWDFVTPIEETLRALDDLVRAGKVRYAGCSNFLGWHVAKATALCQTKGYAGLASIQTQYSLLCRSPEWEIIPACIDGGVSVNVWSPLAAGWLTGKYKKDALPPEGSRMVRAAATQEEWDAILRAGLNTQIPHPSRAAAQKDYEAQTAQRETDRRWRVIEAVGDVAAAHGCSHAQVALAWLLAKPGVCSPVIGASSIAQLQDNIGSLEIRLASAEMEWLDKVSDPGRPYPLDFFDQYGIPWR